MYPPVVGRTTFFRLYYFIFTFGLYNAQVRHHYLLPLIWLFILAGCAERPLPPWEPPLAKTAYQRVRTTAYYDGESDHIRYGKHNALGTTLETGPLNSAAADWGRWPVGTVFRILQTGRTYRVDDYGWALAGRNTIDLYMPTRELMNCWGERWVDIQILQWGDVRESYDTLVPRDSYRHVARMLRELRPQLHDATYEVAASTAPPPAAPAAIPVAQPVVYKPLATTTLQPFY